MAHVACYDIIRDVDLSLTIGGDIDEDLAIQLGDAANVGVRSVLSFMLKARNPNNLRFELSIRNGIGTTTIILTETIGSDVWRVFQEVIGQNVLTATGNTLKVRVLSGAGTLVMSDIVLLYMKDV